MIKGHGDDIYAYPHISANFSSNVFGGLSHEGLKEYLMEKMDCIRNYPEPEAFSLEQELADRYQTDVEGICVTSGATEAIYLIAQAYRESCSAILMPTFSEYADACRLHAHEIVPFYTLDNLPSGVRMVWLCNPNNPTGEIREVMHLRKLVKDHPQCLFIIDQSYEAFTEQEVLEVTESLESSNLLLIHSLTKRFAVPGLRIGYITGNPLLIRHLRTFRMPWSVNALAVEAGRYLLRNAHRFPLHLHQLLEERERVATSLVEMGGLEVWPSDTHFMLVRIRNGRAAALKAFLVEQYGLLIRDASNFEGLDDSYFRVAVQTPEENDRLIEGIRTWIYSY
ncbi:threonine-phosphate decarboxylase [Phocaeicola barnesiae]|uniref:threonine-phosphate decarboxylase n=1 Tax=Phocaeicola barnesiae TaxID=376804 RepID=UPI000364F3CE|nr:threonine-phosphate decarboxylase [Phocaeicola barnesiae]